MDDGAAGWTAATANVLVSFSSDGMVINEGEVQWAGVRFIPVFHHDGHFFRTPGLLAFVRRGAGGERTLLYVDQADNIAAALDGEHRHWADALQLGFNELNVATPIVERIDRLLLRGHIVRRCEPLLNVQDDYGRVSVSENSQRPSYMRRLGAGV